MTKRINRTHHILKKRNQSIYTVKLLEDLGFCNVTDVHDGSKG